MIVIVILAILSVALALGYRQLSLNVRFDNHVSNIERIFQEGRSRSLSTVLIEDTEPTEYYLVELTNHAIELKAFSETLEEIIEIYEFDDDIAIAPEWEVYYFPPNGRVCLSTHTCESLETELNTVLEDDSGTYSASFTINAGGGAIEISR